ncbi:hypothetical protein [Bradyrhizobium archetypum]|uniref:Uncharacterized protein n=1 Tax=Bradyrhizobium archetypum TaxID=2721160 RepID=A0A7Y4H3H7_9BRAD|nr:hypothetical protein [Bradyrhizobium archetypum]NOJ46047.1 hypothetical protein [Bradyrhizobium archetypum]
MVKWVYRTRAGQAQIVPTPKGYALVFDGEPLGHYASPASAAEELANGTCHWPSAGNPSDMGIPEELDEWIRVG